MARYHRKLRFPRKFLKENLSPKLFDFSGAYDLFPFTTVLDDELLKFLENFPLEPDFVAVFNNKNQHGPIENRMIHSDIFFDRNKKWSDILFGVHYELEDTESQFHWWDMKDAEKVFPDSSNDNNRHPRFKRLNGIHYGSRGHLGKLHDSEIIETAEIIGPTLVRTDIPHCVTYQNPNRTRLAFSLRFRSDLKNWDEILDCFKNYTLRAD